MVFTASAETSCEGKATGHTPLYLNEANYIPCRGGYEVAWGNCENCTAICDEGGNAITKTAGDGNHSFDEVWPADYTTCGANYDFTPVEIVDENGVTFTAYGERQFAARMEADI